MSDTITLTSVEKIVIDLKEERDRINNPYNTFTIEQRVVLISSIDLFEQGDILGMIDLMQDKKTKSLFNYPTWEYLNDVFYRVIQDFYSERRVWKRENTND